MLFLRQNLVGIFIQVECIVMENTDGTIDAWFAAPGGEFGEKISYFNETGQQSPMRLLTGSTAAQKFTITIPFYSIDVACPSWATTDSSLTLSLYKWQTDYDTTLASPAIASKIFGNYADDQNLQQANIYGFCIMLRAQQVFGKKKVKLVGL